MQDKEETRWGLIAYCGLYCSNCSKLVKGKCPGCFNNKKASWCKIRLCCIEKGISNCSGCEEFEKVKDCNKYNNVFARVIEFVTKSDRSLCINMIKEQGEEKFTVFMDDSGKMSLPKKGK